METERCYQLEFRELRSGRVSAVVVRATAATVRERVQMAVRGLARNCGSAVEVLRVDQLDRLGYGERMGEQ